MDKGRMRRALGALRRSSSASMLGDRLPEERRPKHALIITITPGGMEEAEPEMMEMEDEEDEDEDLVM